jgi:hypothetical protein
VTERGDAAPDPFERGQRESEELRKALDDLRDDIRAMVREEMARRDEVPADVEGSIREAVRIEVRSHTAPRPFWGSVGLVAVGVVIGLAMGALGYGALVVGADDRESPVATAGEEAEVDAPGASASGSPPDDRENPTPATPDERAALYDSLLATRSARLEPLVLRLEAAGAAAPVLAAVEAWRAGRELDPEERRRLHDGLVQLSLNEEAGAGLALDGLLTRAPCRGSSCGALLELWTERGTELGMPPAPEGAAADSAALAVAERVLVLRRAEAGGSVP